MFILKPLHGLQFTSAHRVCRCRRAKTTLYVVAVAAAMLVGWLCLALFPGFFEACTEVVGTRWRSVLLGIGVLAGVQILSKQLEDRVFKMQAGEVSDVLHTKQGFVRSYR